MHDLCFIGTATVRPFGRNGYEVFFIDGHTAWVTVGGVVVAYETPADRQAAQREARRPPARIVSTSNRSNRRRQAA